MPNDRMINHHNLNHRHTLQSLELRTLLAPKETVDSFSCAGVLLFSSCGVCSSLHTPGSTHLSFREMFIPVLPMLIIMDKGRSSEVIALGLHYVSFLVVRILLLLLKSAFSLLYFSDSIYL
jgi:hypothetical protein